MGKCTNRIEEDGCSGVREGEETEEGGGEGCGEGSEVPQVWKTLSLQGRRMVSKAC